MKALLAADGSEYTRRAAEWLVASTSWLKSPPEIFLLHVHPPLPYPGVIAVVGEQAVEDYQRDESREALVVAEQVLRKAGLAFHSTWLVGEIAPTIASYGKARGVNVVIVGSHGRTPLAGLALGSIATKLVAESKIPVLIVT